MHYQFDSIRIYTNHIFLHHDFKFAVNMSAGAINLSLFFVFVVIAAAVSSIIQRPIRRVAFISYYSYTSAEKSVHESFFPSYRFAYGTIEFCEKFDNSK